MSKFDLIKYLKDNELTVTSQLLNEHQQEFTAKNKVINENLNNYVREFVQAGEELRIRADEHPELKNLMEKHFGPDWQKKFYDMLMDFDYINL